MIRKPPQVKLKQLPNGTKREFLSIETVFFQAEYPNSEVSEEFSYDIVRQKNVDGVMVVAYDAAGLWLRGCVRPPIYERFGPEYGNQWEVVAGGIDPGERPEQAAVRELFEETGFVIEERDLEPLGHPLFSHSARSPCLMHFYCAKVSRETRREPTTDASPLERFGEIIEVDFQTAKKLYEDGYIWDLKTELALRKFFQRLT